MLDLYRSILITGGAGLVARALADSLRRRGLGFTALSHKDCDITRPEDVQRTFEAHRPSLLLNCAAYTKVDACELDAATCNAVNGHAAEIVADACRRFGTVLVHYSTNYVFDGQIGRPYRPTDQPAPLSAYGKSKLLGEQSLIRMANLPWLIVRTAGLFGRYGPCFPASVIARARTAKSFEVVNDQLTQVTSATDLSEITLKLLDAGVRNIWHVTNEGAVTWFEVAQGVLEIFNCAGDVRPVTSAAWCRSRSPCAPRPVNGLLDCDALTELGIRAPTWRTALENYRTDVIGHKN